MISPASTIQGVVFDLDNTLLDFMKMKEMSVNSALKGMEEAGLHFDFDVSKRRIFDIYEEKGWEYQEVFDVFIKEKLGHIDYKMVLLMMVD